MAIVADGPGEPFADFAGLGGADGGVAGEGFLPVAPGPEWIAVGLAGAGEAAVRVGPLQRREAAPATSQEQAIPAGGFTFVPQGSPLTYQQAATLPGTPGGLAAVITAHVRAYAGPNPPASLLLKQVAFLIATAPLTRAARSAAWQVVGSLAGLRICPAGAWAQPPRPVQLCAASAGDETLVSIDVRTASILSISEILLRPSPLYPHVAAGKVVGSTSFPA